MSGDLSQAQLKMSQEQQVTILKNIEQLQQQEKSLYNKLEVTSATSGDTAAQQPIIDKINELSDMRIGLFKSLTSMYDQLQNSVAETRVDLVDQMTVVGVVEHELNNAKANLNKLQDTRHSRMRLVEINTYYGKRYEAHAGVMRLLIFICVPLLILAILGKKGIISGNIANTLTLIVIVIGVFVLGRRLIDLYYRSNMNYDEYTWDFDPTNMNPTVYEYDKAQLQGTDIKKAIQDDAKALAAGVGLGCIGQSCCSDGMSFDEKKNKCVEILDKDSFVSGQLNTTSFIAPSSVVCPWGGRGTTVKAFSPAGNYATV